MASFGHDVYIYPIIDRTNTDLTMWHEARRREKATQKLFNDHKKRAEKRREENRVDPSSFLQVNGVKAKICLDPNVYKQAATSMVAWQGDSKLMIDRFDVRATLESIPKGQSSKSKDKSKQNSRNAGVLDIDESSPMKTLLDYERYRLLIQNDLNGVAEESRLNLVSKSDIFSDDAKLRKLKGNKFGTSGETSSDHAVHSRSLPVNKESTTRRAPVGPTYNSVPPPSSLTTNQSSSSYLKSSCRNEQKTESPCLANEIIDLDDYDNFDPDQVDIRDNSKHTGDVAKKYGLSNEQLILLSELDNDEASIHESLSKLKTLAKKARSEQDKHVYGPALPPELLKIDQNHANAPSSKDSSSPSDNDSPVPQRSPSGASMPLREESRVADDKLSDEDEPSDNQQPEIESVPSKPVPVQAPELNTLSDSTKDPSSNGQDRRETELTPKVRRRASTPLAYRRNRRSSRSLSRERRKDKSSRSRRSHRGDSSSSNHTSSPDRTEFRSSRRHHRENFDRSRKRARDR